MSPDAWSRPISPRSSTGSAPSTARWISSGDRQASTACRSAPSDTDAPRSGSKSGTAQVKLRLSAVASQLRDETDSSGPDVKRYFFAHRLSAQLTSTFNLALWETTVLSGVDRSFDAPVPKSGHPAAAGQRVRSGGRWQRHGWSRPSWRFLTRHDYRAGSARAGRPPVQEPHRAHPHAGPLRVYISGVRSTPRPHRLARTLHPGFEPGVSVTSDQFENLAANGVGSAATSPMTTSSRSS